MTESCEDRVALVLKARVAVAVLYERSSTAELALENNGLPSQEAAWKRLGRKAVKAAITPGRRKREQQSVVPLQLAKIGYLQMWTGAPEVKATYATVLGLPAAQLRQKSARARAERALASASCRADILAAPQVA